MQDIEEMVVLRTKAFANQVESLRFSGEWYVYNPLSYAWPMHEAYLRRYLSHPVRTLLLGMNPGPFGMAQTGVPFGEIQAVKEFLHLAEPIGKPLVEHPARPITGFDCKRSEVSGRRVWGLLSQHYGTSEAFSQEMGILNYCPLVFMDRKPTAKNLTPDKLPKGERIALEAICNSYLGDMIELLQPSFLIGVGKYAYVKLQSVASDPLLVIASIIHPSPGNPQANQQWNEKTTRILEELGVW